jgi:peroxiredoxin Q/BCP
MTLGRTIETLRLALRDLFRKKGEAKMLNIGDPAPDFTVETHRGEKASLSGERGKWIVLWFYPKADTPG